MSWTINERLDVERQVVLNLCLDIARGVWTPGDALPAPEFTCPRQNLEPADRGSRRFRGWPKPVS